MYIYIYIHAYSNPKEDTGKVQSITILDSELSKFSLFGVCNNSIIVLWGYDWNVMGYSTCSHGINK